MQKFLVSLILSFVITNSCCSHIFAERKYIGETVFTDNLVFIDGNSIPAAQLPNKFIYIPVEALSCYGFDISLDTRPATLDLSEGKYIYTIKYNTQKEINATEYTQSDAAEKLKSQTSVYTANRSEVYFEGDNVPANIFETENGTAVIQSDELAKFGTYTWNDQTHTVSIEFNKNTVLPRELSFSGITGIISADDVRNAVIVGANGTCADISDADFKKWINVYISFSSFDLVTAPNDAFDLPYYIKFYGNDTPKEYTVYSNSGIIYGKFGESAVSHGNLKQNCAWYLPYIGNARNTLYSANETLYQKYLNENGEVFEGILRNAAQQDKAFIPDKNILPLSGASEWAQSEIRKSAACNLLPYELTDKYRENITRSDFCSLIYRLVAIEFSPKTDSRMGEWFAAESIMEEKNMKQKFSEIHYSDCNDDKIKFLSAANIIHGMDDGTFSPDGILTREQAAAILFRTSEFLGNKTISSNGFVYNDDKNISDWAKSAVNSMNSMDIMKGITQNTFAPKDGFTVEQAITTIIRLYECA